MYQEIGAPANVPAYAIEKDLPLKPFLVAQVLRRFERTPD